ncbi:facilitated trehalose transporter Tret1-2 homolog [Periplaneta americana]|uniref:facilitated trehalose transporter Tret1-2 homolog n=1 Tax=Periplaneta americana TaxID=6978 RepID=UPI0037E8FD41
MKYAATWVCSKKFKGRLRQFTASLIVNIMNVAHGVVMGWPSPSLPILRSNKELFGALSDDQESWIGSLPFLAALLSSPFFSYVNQNMGRKTAGYISAVPNIIGWLLVIFGNSATLLSIGRFIMGLGLSGMNIFITLYIGEVSEDSIRGALGVLRGLGLDLGFLIIFVVGSYLSIQNTAIISISLPVLFILTYLWLPESPMYLLGKKDDKKALESYLWMRGGDTQVAEEELSKLSAVMAENSAKEQKLTMKELLSVRGTRKALLIGIVLAVCQQFSGLNPMYSYCAVIFETIGGHFTPEISSFIVSAVGILGSFFCFFFSDKLGRRVLLISTYSLQGICLCILGAYMYMRDIGMDVSEFGVLPVVTISFYSFFVVVGPCNMYYVVLSEIFRPEARGITMGFTNTLLWFLAFIILKFYSTLVSLLGVHGSFWFFAAFSFIGALFVFIVLPETKNRSLESILIELNGLKE